MTSVVLTDSVTIFSSVDLKIVYAVADGNIDVVDLVVGAEAEVGVCDCVEIIFLPVVVGVAVVVKVGHVTVAVVGEVGHDDTVVGNVG